MCVLLCPFKFCHHLDWEKRAGCFALFVFLVSRDCCVPRVCLQFVIVLFPDHTHFLFVYGSSVKHICHLSRSLLDLLYFYQRKHVGFTFINVLLFYYTQWLFLLSSGRYIHQGLMLCGLLDITNKGCNHCDSACSGVSNDTQMSALGFFTVYLLKRFFYFSFL